MSVSSQDPAQGAGTSSRSTAQEVGWLFVPQYYSVLNSDPSRLHCFYNKRSTFVHGTEGEETRARHGQQEIHEKILSLGFSDCRVFVSSVDSQSSAENGIVVQVLGEMSNNGGEYRKFAQTFFLAEQPSGYFVLNDIFRFLKEEDDRDDAHRASSPAPANISVPLPPKVEEPEHSFSSHLQSQTPNSDFTLEQEVEEIRRSPAVQQHQVNGWHHHVEPPAAPTAIEKPPLPVQQPPQQPEPAAEPEVAIEAPEPAEPAAVEQSAAAVVEPASAPAPIPQPSAPATQPVIEAAVAAAPPVKKTWANLAASSGAWKTNVSSSAKGVSAQAPAQQSNGPVASASQPQPTASTSQPALTPSGRPIPNLAGINHPNCFVKNVQEQVTDEGLRRTLEDNFGPIKELDIVRSKACAFLEFKNVESAKRAIQYCSPHSVGGNGGIECDGMFLHIEERKPKGDPGRLSNTPRGGGRVGAGMAQTGRGGAAAGGQQAGRGGAPSYGSAASGRSATVSSTASGAPKKKGV